MKYFYSIFFVLSLSPVFAEHAPIKHAIDPTCQYQVANAVIGQTTARYGANYQILRAGLYVDIYAKLESYPTISLSKTVIPMRHRATGRKFEVYYSGRSGSPGLDTNGRPIHSCRVSIEQISQAEYEASGTPEVL